MLTKFEKSVLKLAKKNFKKNFKKGYSTSCATSAQTIGVVANHVTEKSPKLFADIVPLLVESLTDRNDDLRKNALIALGEINFHVEVPAAPIIKLLSDRNSEIRKEAASAIEEIGKRAKDAIDGLIECLEDWDYKVRCNAILALKVIGEEPEKVVPKLCEMLHDREDIVILLAIGALGNFEEDAQLSIPELIKKMKSENQEIRYQTAESIGEIGGDPAILVPLLIESIDDTFKINRKELSGDSDIVKLLVGLFNVIKPDYLKDIYDLINSGKKDIELPNLFAINAIKQFGEKAKPYVLKNLSSKSVWIKLGCMEVINLLDITDEEVVPVLEGFLESEDEEVRELSLKLIKEFKDEK